MPTRLPDKIYVRDFSFDKAVVRVDREGEELKKFEDALAERFSKELAKQIERKLSLPAERLPAGMNPPPGQYAWIVSGDFHTITQGSRILRVVVGFSAGATKKETTARFYEQGQSQPFLTVNTTGGSGSMPGIILGLWPTTWYFMISNAVGAALLANDGLTMDGNRTAREITRALGDYLYTHRLIEEDITGDPKRMGTWQGIHWQSHMPSKKDKATPGN